MPSKKCCSLGTQKNRPTIDRGTSNLQRTTPPVSAGHERTPGSSAAAVSWDRAAFRYWALSEAWTVSYAMTGLSSLIGNLAGDFLRMYLRHEVDQKAVLAAGSEIGKSRQWHELESNVGERLRFALGKNLVSVPSANQIASMARNYLLTRKTETGIEFRGELNAIIGGVKEIDVTGAAMLSTSPPSLRDGVIYRIDVRLWDTYQFTGNRRSGEYDALRKQWAALLAQGEYGRVYLDYHSTMIVRPKDVNLQQVFASLMYAIEDAGMTPGPLEWSVVVPMVVTIKSPA
jgi:hypothetical protein